MPTITLTDRQLVEAIEPLLTGYFQQAQAAGNGTTCCDIMALAAKLSRPEGSAWPLVLEASFFELGLLQGCLTHLHDVNGDPDDAESFVFRPHLRLLIAA